MIGPLDSTTSPDSPPRVAILVGLLGGLRRIAGGQPADNRRRACLTNIRLADDLSAINQSAHQRGERARDHPPHHRRWPDRHRRTQRHPHRQRPRRPAPLTITLGDFNNVEKVGELPRPLTMDGVPAGADPEINDIGYYAPSNGLVFYYGNVGYFNGIVRLGRFSGQDMDVIERQPDGREIIDRRRLTRARHPVPSPAIVINGGSGQREGHRRRRRLLPLSIDSLG